MLTELATKRPSAARVRAQEGRGVLHLDEVVRAPVARAERLAAQASSAPGVGAHGGVGFRNLGETVITSVVRAERFAALGNSARLAFAHNVHGVVDRSLAIRAFDGVAVLRLPRGVCRQLVY